jgi:two-component system sporulation sensor kinase A
MLIMIAIIFGLIEILFLDESFKKESIDLIIAVAIAWFIGRQYDKMNFYMMRARESEDNYKQLIETLPESILIHDQSRILYINKAGEDMLGVQRKNEVLGKFIYDLIYSNYYQELATIRLKHLLEKRILTSNVGQKLLRLDGEIIFVEVSSRVITFEGKEAILSTVKDVTDKKKETEILLEKSEKLALVGQMAAGIAHEICNPLTSIKGFIQLFKSKYKNEEEYFNLVLSELERINLVIGEFLVLSKPTALVFKPKDIRSLLKDVVTLISPQAITNNVHIILECELEITQVVCEESQLKKVFINILKNAIEAMPNGGIIKVKIKKKETNRISICFIDQGSGIPKDRLLTLGEPFYTTKRKGTGLGLMVSCKVVENHDGERLMISSKVNEGTRVEVILPIVPRGHVVN